MIGEIAYSLGLAISFGFLTAVGGSLVLNKLHLTHKAIFTIPVFVFVVFGLAELLGFSGYVTSFAFGITIGNMDSFNSKRLKFLSSRNLAWNN